MIQKLVMHDWRYTVKRHTRVNNICVASLSAYYYEGGGHVALKGTLYSGVTCPGGRVTLVQ